jgi:hypothetical protein
MKFIIFELFEGLIHLFPLLKTSRESLEERESFYFQKVVSLVVLMKEPLKQRPFYIGHFCLIFSKVLFLSLFAHLIGLKAARAQRYKPIVFYLSSPNTMARILCLDSFIEYSS